MFEEFTQDNLLKLALQKSKELNVSVIEGSLCYNSAALMSVMLEDLADEAERIYINSFPDSCDREHLINFASRRGLTPQAAIKAKVKCESNVDLPVGTIVSGEELNYTVIESLGTSDGKYYMLLECESEGEVGNSFLGEIYPVDYVEGFESGKITEIVIKGKEEEDTEDFRKRYFEAVDVLPMAGNKAYYEKYVREAMPELKYVRVTYEDGYVVLTVGKEDLTKPDKATLDELSEIMGESGDGYAPINHLVKTKAADVVELPIEVTLELDSDVVKADIEAEFKKNLDSYFETVNESFGKEDRRIVRTSMIINAATSIQGVVDCTNIKFGGSATGNLSLGMSNLLKVGDVICNY